MARLFAVNFWKTINFLLAVLAGSCRKMKMCRDYYFFAQGKDSKDYKLNPAKIINFEKGKALLVDKKSFVTSTNEEDLMVDIGENVGALINLNSEICRGLSFINSDFGMLPLNDFIEVVESMQLTN